MVRFFIIAVLLCSFLPCIAQEIIDLDKLEFSTVQKVDANGNINVTEQLQVRERDLDFPDLPEEAKPLEMVRIEPGSFTMGSSSDEGGRDPSEWQPHSVEITQPFYIGRYEVTQAQWEAVMGTTPASDLGTPWGVGDNYPVYYVSWDDCQEFLVQLNSLDMGEFRLPTEAEWEYACRAATDTRYSFGDALECVDTGSTLCMTMNTHSWWIGNRLHAGEAEGCQAVGRKTAHAWGLYDMHGNVFEWCSDGWQDPYDRGAQSDPVLSPNDSFRIIRGGYWYSHAQYCRSAFRGKRTYDIRHYSIGLRVVKSVEPTHVEEFILH